MASADSSKKSRTKPPKGRPISTSAISQSAVEHAAHLTALSSFSPKSDYFAFLSLAVGKHRLRVYDTTTGQAIADHTLETARATSIAWAYQDAEGGHGGDVAPSPNKKRRKKRHSQAAGQAAQPTGPLILIIAQSDGSVLFFAPEHNRVVKTLSHVTSTAAILSVAVSEHNNTLALWTSSADGAIRLWLPSKNGLAGTWKSDDRIPYTSLAVLPSSSSDEDEPTSILAAHHSMRLLSMSSPDSDLEAQKPTQVASFTGHASSIKQLQWDVSQQPPTRFVSVAESDRIVYIWEVPSDGSSQGKIVASVPLDSDAQAISLSEKSEAKRQTLLTLSTSGRISIYPVPAELTPPATTKGAQSKVSTLLPRANISSPSKGSSAAVRTAAATFMNGEEGTIKVARVIGGVRPVFNTVKYIDALGDFIQDFTLDEVPSGLINSAVSSQDHQTHKPNRYAETTAAIASGADLGQDQEMDDLVMRAVDGELDADLAELSLGQRLAVMSGPAGGASRSDGSDSEGEDAPRPADKMTSRSRKKVEDSADLAPASSLTRTLIQALHSSDARLLETCLAHSNRNLIHNTVRRLPPQLAVPLVTACVERLGRGKGGATMRGRGAGASSQRGTALITWVKAVLTMHSGHLMTMPDLIARLSGLHATLTARLALQDSLLSLSGRLDMVLSQIEMRSSAAPAPISVQKGKAAAAGKREVRQYVEGESEDEDNQMDVEVEVDDSDDAASVEDVELGGDSDAAEEDEGDDDDTDGEEDDDDDLDPTMNGFIDDEAEEDDEEDEEDESE